MLVRNIQHARVCVGSQWCVSESQLENGSKQIVLIQFLAASMTRTSETRRMLIGVCRSCFMRTCYEQRFLFAFKEGETWPNHSRAVAGGGLMLTFDEKKLGCTIPAGSSSLPLALFRM